MLVDAVEYVVEDVVEDVSVDVVGGTAIVGASTELATSR